MRAKNTVWISIVFSTEERDAVNKAAKAAGMSRNAWIREVLAGATS